MSASKVTLDGHIDTQEGKDGSFRHVRPRKVILTPEALAEMEERLNASPDGELPEEDQVLLRDAIRHLFYRQGVEEERRAALQRLHSRIEIVGLRQAVDTWVRDIWAQHE